MGADTLGEESTRKDVLGHSKETKKRYRRPDVSTVSEKQSVKGGKGWYCEYHKSKTHNTVNCSVFKREMEDKNLKWNLVEVERSLRAKFDAENAKHTIKECDQPRKILMISSKRGKQEEHDGVDNLTRSMQGLTFSAKDPWPIGWRGDDPLIIQGSIKDITIHWVYIDTGSSGDIV